jgi:hypothetical protein
MALFRNLGVNQPEVDEVCGIACATYLGAPPRNPLIFFTLGKIAYCWFGN